MVTAVDSRLSISGGSRSIRIGATWWRPRSEPLSLLWLQHGFLRDRARLAGLAAHLAANGALVLTTSLRSVDPFGRTVQHLWDNTAFLTDLADTLLGAHGHLTAAWAAAGGATPLPQRICVAGHSAGADAAAYVAGRLVDRADLAAVVLLDPVRSARGSNLATGLERLSATTVPVRIVAAAPGRCNAHGSGVATALTHLSGYAGVRLRHGCHTDAEGSDTDRMAAWLCGSPDPANVAALRNLTSGWITAPGTTAAGPDSPLVTELVASGRGELLWGHKGSMSSTR